MSGLLQVRQRPDILNNTGEVAEWLKAHAWKACVRRESYREFESHPLRQIEIILLVNFDQKDYDYAITREITDSIAAIMKGL